MAKNTVQDQLAKIQKKVDALKLKEKALRSKANGSVIAQIVALAKKHQITTDEIVLAMDKKKSSTKMKPDGPTKKSTDVRKVPAKFRDPSNAERTWSGRGIMPTWVKSLKESGLLDTALIVAE